MTRTMLSTKDNPFNPYENFDEWLRFDQENQYNSLNYLARIAIVSDAMSEEQVEDEVERAIDEIIKFDFRNIFIKVREPEETDLKEPEMVGA